MQNSCLSLLKVQLITQFRLNSISQEKDPKKRTQKILLAATLVLIPFILTLYTFGLSYGLCQLGLERVIPSYALTISCLMTFFLSILKTNGVLFAFKDYDIVMSLPVKTSTIIASRFLTLYLANTLLACFIMLPMAIPYCMVVKPSVMFYVVWLVGTLLASLIPTTLAAMLGALIIAFASRFKYTNFLAIVLSFGLFLGIMIAPVFLTTTPTLPELADLGALIEGQINQLYPLSKLFSAAAVSSHMSSFLAFIVISIGWYYLFIKLLAYKYKAINTALTTHRTAHNFKVQALSQRSPLKALYHKELKRYFGSYVYILNTGIGIIMALLVAFTILIIGPEKLVELMQLPPATAYLTRIVPYCICMMFALSCTSCTALSLEGNNLWIVQSTPLPPKTLFDSKILVNLTLLVPSSIVCSILLIFAFKADLVTSLFFFTVPLAYSFFISVWGMFINTKFPRFDWESDTQIVKQSSSSFIGLFGGAAFALVPLGLMLLLSEVTSHLLNSLTILFIVTLTVILYKKLCGMKTFY